ncbi:hypothetical protein F5890DRAFT_1626154 [Lentinula detonsa]|uniref:Uncharacterized protein n=1 Tax=Lentinula detonsa TaxID=2804962 RepID=A0AA38UQK1_9AGAR|nr:hypothetical protein F5890DRAFT_1626154 [Lentinula detonsa]
MDPLLTYIPNRFMPAIPAGLTSKLSALNSQDRSERARRRNITYANSTLLTPSADKLVPLVVTPLPEPHTEAFPSPVPSRIYSIVSTPITTLPTSSVSLVSSNMARNVSGSGWVNMGTLKAGCQLLIPNPNLNALEELWRYVITNLEDCDITDEAVKKKEFLHCVAKWSTLKDTNAEILHSLPSKAWVKVDTSSTDPDDFTCRPFFDTICDKILGNDWAHTYDLKCDKYMMLPDAMGFSKLVTLMEMHNRCLRGTMYHCSNEVLQTLIMQKLPDKFRTDLRDCKVSEKLPYADWKTACKDVEEHQPPTLPTTTHGPKRADSRLDICINTSNSAAPGPQISSAFQVNAKTHRCPKLHPEQKRLLIRLDTCFCCYNLFAGHLSNDCPNNGPPSLSVPFQPLNENDVTLAMRIHTAAPNNSIPYELILKRNMVSASSTNTRIALTELPDLDHVAPPTLLSIEPSNVAAFYSSRNIVHSTLGADVYGNSLSCGLSGYGPSRNPVCKPVANDPCSL